MENSSPSTKPQPTLPKRLQSVAFSLQQDFGLSFPTQSSPPGLDPVPVQPQLTAVLATRGEQNNRLPGGSPAAPPTYLISAKGTPPGPGDTS